MYIIYIYDIHSCKHTYIHSFIDTYIRSKHSIHSFTFFNLEFCRLVLPANVASSLLILPPLFSSLLPLFSSFLLLPLSLQPPLFSSYCHCRLFSPCCAALSRLVVPPFIASVLGSCCYIYCDKKFTGMHKKYTHGHNTYINIHMQ